MTRKPKVTFALITLSCLEELDRCLAGVELIPRKDVDEILALINKKQQAHLSSAEVRKT